MTTTIRKNFSKILLALFLLSFVAVACKNKKDKKEETPAADTTKVEAMPPATDTTAMDKDTADTRPVMPGEGAVDPVKPGEGSQPPPKGK